MRRSKLQRNARGLLPPGSHESGAIDYMTERDFVIGETVNILGRNFLVRSGFGSLFFLQMARLCLLPFFC